MVPLCRWYGHYCWWYQYAQVSVHECKFTWKVMRELAWVPGTPKNGERLVHTVCTWTLSPKDVGTSDSFLIATSVSGHALGGDMLKVRWLQTVWKHILPSRSFFVSQASFAKGVACEISEWSENWNQCCMTMGRKARYLCMWNSVVWPLRGIVLAQKWSCIISNFIASILP